jgi:hypothetical protein
MAWNVAMTDTATAPGRRYLAVRLQARLVTE